MTRSTVRGARASLFETGPAGEVWTGSRALVPFPAGVCPECAGELRLRGVFEPTLFRHGGHGATRETVAEVCACGYQGRRQTTEVSPR